MLISGAEGRYLLHLAASVAVAAAANLVAGQSAVVRCPMAMQPPLWTYTGEGPAFLVGAGAELEIEHVTITAASGLVFQIVASVTLRLTHVRLQNGDGSASNGEPKFVSMLARPAMAFFKSVGLFCTLFQSLAPHWPRVSAALDSPASIPAPLLWLWLVHL